MTLPLGRRNGGGPVTCSPSSRAATPRYRLPDRRASRRASTTPTRPTTVPSTEAKTRRLGASTHTTTRKPASPTGTATRQYSISRRARAENGARRTSRASAAGAPPRSSGPRGDITSPAAVPPMGPLSRSGIPLGQHYRARSEQDRGVEAEQAQPGPRWQGVGDRLDRGQRVRRDRFGQELLHRGLQRGRERYGPQRQHEDDPDRGRDGADRVPDDRPQAQADERGQAEIGAAHQHGPQDAGLAEGGVRGRTGHRGLAGQEAGEGQDLPGGQGHGAEHGRLRREDQRAVRYGGERRPDHPGGELAGDHQRAQGGHQELAEDQAREAVIGRVERRPGRGRHVGPVGWVDGQDQDRQADHRGGREGEQPAGRADAAELDPLHPGHAGEPVVPPLTTGGRNGGHRDGGHASLLSSAGSAERGPALRPWYPAP